MTNEDKVRAEFEAWFEPDAENRAALNLWWSPEGKTYKAIAPTYLQGAWHGWCGALSSLPALGGGEGWKLVPTVPTDAMVTAYLQANAEYWVRTDEIPPPPDRWRTGRPFDATAYGYRAMLAVAPLPPSPKEQDRG